VSASPAGESRVVARPLTVVGVVVAVLGFRRRSPLLVFAGGLGIGAGLKLAPPREE
jgi:hypothetical protein